MKRRCPFIVFIMITGTQYMNTVSLLLRSFICGASCFQYNKSITIRWTFIDRNRIMVHHDLTIKMTSPIGQYLRPVEESKRCTTKQPIMVPKCEFTLKSLLLLSVPVPVLAVSVYSTLVSYCWYTCRVRFVEIVTLNVTSNHFKQQHVFITKYVDDETCIR
jgi:hypothetical protein